MEPEMNELVVEVNENSETRGESKVLAEKSFLDHSEPICRSEDCTSRSNTDGKDRFEAGSEKRDVEEEKTKVDDCVIDIVRSRNDEILKPEKVCRICHFDSEPSSGRSELILLGCDCKGELGISHRYCAETWFQLRESRLCEICGKTVTNLNTTSDDTSIFMLEWNEMRLVATTLDTSQESSRRCKKYFLNIILVCLVLVFVLPWFCRDNIL